ncbi:MAG: hypothetical protein LBK52_04840 [Deltaproteobacteria bacterium]|jgi:hypothetical protein|nr:hypothetical protein [Deltaproteobacteria bacterium]
MTQLWAWPAVTGQLTPPRKAFYLTWPAWQAWCAEELDGENHPDMVPYLLEDPPFFRESLASLTALIREGGTLSLKHPFWNEEAASISASLAGRPQTEPSRAEPARACLILALDCIARRESRLASALVRKARQQKTELLRNLRGEDIPPELSPPAENPPPGRAALDAWRRLARGILKPGDCLWPVSPELKPEDFGPEANPAADADGCFPCPAF